MKDEYDCLTLCKKHGYGDFLPSKYAVLTPQDIFNSLMFTVTTNISPR